MPVRTSRPGVVGPPVRTSRPAASEVVHTDGEPAFGPPPTTSAPISAGCPQCGSTANCLCLLEAGDGISIDGNGSSSHPFVITNTRPVAWRHIQGVSAAVWDIVHNLGFRPNVTAFDSAGTQVEGEIVHIDANHLTVSYFVAGIPVAFGGEAELS